MRIAVLGANGRSGCCFVEQALAAGHHIVALVRSPEKVKQKHEELEVHKVDVFNQESLATGMRGADTLVSCLAAPTIRGKVTFFSDTTPVIVSAMRQEGIKRFIMMSAAFAKKSPGEPFFVWFFLRPVLLGRVLEDLTHAEVYLHSNCKDLDYTIVKPPGLTMDAIDDRSVLTSEGEFVAGAAIRMSRAHVAKFMIACLTDETWNGKSVSVGLST